MMPVEMWKQWWREAPMAAKEKYRYYYDALNQLVREDNQKQNKTICYTYDVGGNMSEETSTVISKIQ